MQHARRLAVVLSTALCAPFAAGQGTGADVIVGDLLDTANYGANAGIYAYAIGTVSCNIGTAQLSWIAGNNQHPVIGQNLYRYFPGSAAAGQYGRFEMVGMSWLKHGFTALTQSLCNTCVNPNSGGTTLGIGCSDPYVAALNGTQSGLGPRFDVNAFTGAYTFPHVSPVGNGTIAGRLQVLGSDLSTTNWPGAQFFGEAQYVTPDDAAAGNHFNNVSWRPMSVTGAAYNLAVAGSTQRQQPALFAWKQIDAAVSMQVVDVPGEGRFYVAYRPTALAGGQYHHEYAIFNQNSDRSAGSFAVTLPPGVTASNVGFHDVPYHSGEPWVGTDWTATNVAGNAVTWACDTQAANPNANALRWGTTYNFRFDAPSPFLDTVSIGLWKAGTPAAVSAVLCPSPDLPQNLSGGAYVASNPATTPYDFVQTNGLAGVQAGPTGDDNALTVALPFPFLLYDRWLTSLTISTNGYVCAPGQDGTAFQNATTPTAGGPESLIAVFWDDLNVGAPFNPGGVVEYVTVGTAPTRRFVVRWKNVRRNLTTPVHVEDHELILDEGSQDVTLTCVSSQSFGSSATRGIENATGISGTLISHNQANSVLSGTSRKLTLSSFPSVPRSARLDFTGYGFGGDTFTWDIVSEPNSLLTLFVDLVPGPLSFGLLGSLDIALSPFMLPLADATGIFGPLDPTATTDACNRYQLSYPIPQPGLPSGITLYFQGLVWSFNAPNLLCHITTLQTLTT
jgi:hypothetical protein